MLWGHTWGREAASVGDALFPLGQWLATWALEPSRTLCHPQLSGKLWEGSHSLEARHVSRSHSSGSRHASRVTGVPAVGGTGTCL